MIVTRSTFDAVLGTLKKAPRLALDTETTGLRPYHGDRLFSIIIAIAGGRPFYFNFQPYPGLDAENVLLPSHLARLQELLGDPSKFWYIHNAKFDLAILANDNLTIAGTVHCTKAQARVEYNEHHSYDLASCAERIGFKKDDRVEAYIHEQNLWEWVVHPHKKQRTKNKHYDRVPFPIISEYGLIDGDICARVGESQEKAFDLAASQTPAPLPSIRRIVDNERKLTKAVFRMESRGVLIDLPYTKRAQAYELDRHEKAVQAFKRETGREFQASPKLFQEVFADERDKWLWGDPSEITGKVNPQFDYDGLRVLANPAAKIVLDIRDTKSRADFYAGFIYHADSHGVVHPNFSPDGARSGRFSSSEPNLQNLTAENASICRACKEEYEGLVDSCKACKSRDIEHPEFLVRRAIIPRPGFIFIMPDYDQMEYRMMFEYACKMVGGETDIVRKIKYDGLDPHQATADVVTAGGTPLTRKRAKNGNFAVLYGSGYDTLAATIGSTREEAKALKNAILNAAPEMRIFTQEVENTILQRGFIRNWAGRRSYFPDKNYAYKGPNYLIQGGCADVNKFALTQLDEFFLDMKSKLVLTIHDEDPIEVHESEIDTVPRRVKEIMEQVFPWKYLPLTAGMEFSTKSLGDKIKGFPA